MTTTSNLLSISFEVQAMRDEFDWMLDSSDVADKALAAWWSSRTDSEIESIGMYILNGDYIWNVFRMELLESMHKMKEEIQNAEIS
jgi:dsDNA-binding SOS-regulon protein